MLTGSCLCKTVTWQIDATEQWMTHCHCSMCRKSHGAPFATYLGAPREAFRWTGDTGSIVRYESSPGYVRAFCGECGSVVPGPESGAHVSIPAGGLDTDPDLRPSAHIFVRDKVAWLDVDPALQAYDEYPASTGLQAVETTRPERAPGAPLGGSCLCGSVRFEVTEPFKRAHHCHCSRCRKARAAAHTSNGFTSMDGVRFVAGEDLLETYKLPEARFFTQCFCGRCGSPMPRIDAARGIAVVPYASLDGDPGHPVDSHIFVGSAAPWYTITDDVPRHPEGAPA